MINYVIGECITEKVSDFFKYIFLLFIGYFSPIHDVVHVVLFVFFVDVFYGWRVASKLRNESFNPSIVWRKTIPRVILSLVAMILAFMIDIETGQKWVSSYSIIGWAICALLVLSILKNGYILTQWSPLDIVGKILKNKMEKESGITIDSNKL